MIPLSARSEAARELFHERFVAKRPWAIKLPKLNLALILISYVVVNGEDESVAVKTWTTGSTAKAALRSWLKQRPHVHPDTVEHTIVTESKIPGPIGRPPEGET